MTCGTRPRPLWKQHPRYASIKVHEALRTNAAPHSAVAYRLVDSDARFTVAGAGAANKAQRQAPVSADTANSVPASETRAQFGYETGRRVITTRQEAATPLRAPVSVQVIPAPQYIVGPNLNAFDGAEHLLAPAALMTVASTGPAYIPAIITTGAVVSENMRPVTLPVESAASPQRNGLAASQPQLAATLLQHDQQAQTAYAPSSANNAHVGVPVAAAGAYPAQLNGAHAQEILQDDDPTSSSDAPIGVDGFNSSVGARHVQGGAPAMQTALYAPPQPMNGHAASRASHSGVGMPAAASSASGRLLAAAAQLNATRYALPDNYSVELVHAPGGGTAPLPGIVMALANVNAGTPTRPLALHLRAPVQSHSKIALPCGSTVHVRAGMSLMLPTSFCAAAAADQHGVVATAAMPLNTLVLMNIPSRTRMRCDLCCRRTTILLWEFAFTVEVLIVILYWGGGALIDVGLTTSGLEDDQLISSVLQHAILAWLLVDFVCNRFPVIPAHFLWMLLPFVVYTGVNVAYSLTSDPVYSTLTWRNVRTPLIFLLGAGLLVTALFALWAVTFLRDIIAYRCRRARSDGKAMDAQTMHPLPAAAQ